MRIIKFNKNLKKIPGCSSSAHSRSTVLFTSFLSQSGKLTCNRNFLRCTKLTFRHSFIQNFRFRNKPYLLAFTLIGLTAIFKSYPCYGEVGFYTALLPTVAFHLVTLLFTVIINVRNIFGVICILEKC